MFAVEACEKHRTAWKLQAGTTLRGGPLGVSLGFGGSELRVYAFRPGFSGIGLGGQSFGATDKTTEAYGLGVWV